MLSDLTDDTITAYFAYLRKEELAAATIAKEYAQLTAIWRFACQRHKVGLYPTVAKPNVPRNEPQSWLREDLERLFKAIYSLDGWIGEVREPAWWLALHFVIWNTGERITALLSVKWSDIDLDGGWITIRAEYRKGKSRGKVHRLAPYTIEALRAIQLPERELVFEWHKSPKYLWQAYGEILKKAGLPNDRYSKFHRLRRTVATQYELLGGNATNLLGHSDRKTTVEHYLDRRVVVEPQAIDLLTRPDVATPANEPQQVSELEWL
jgi:integrase